ncbi:hypothetical protein PHLCEN_2v10336 [Hermanssonia centrifuga]|uniref:Uncharacterized protein n=1 Tax=Hermanssonia centrifuga TaxID=98765 RepID=A0A2R6NN61_9APHY|nr:hypothetical protein PHLCEN_2v10336 [Hermanssonia centrifuga]
MEDDMTISTVICLIFGPTTPRKDPNAQTWSLVRQATFTSVMVSTEAVFAIRARRNGVWE